MESYYTNRQDSTSQGLNIESNTKMDQKDKRMETWELILRLVALGLTMAAAIILGLDKQTKIVPMQVVPTLPPIDVPVTAKWQYLSAFVFCVVANTIASAYAAICLLLLCLTEGGQTGRLRANIIIADMTMVALLFSADGAATAIGLMGYQGNSHLRWNKVCNDFGTFCDKVGASLIISLVGGLAFLLLAAFAVIGLQKRAK